MDIRINEIKDIYNLNKDKHGFDIVEIFDREIGLSYYKHNCEGFMINPKLKADMWLSVLYNKTNSISCKDYENEWSEHIYDELKKIEKSIKEKRSYFSCICTQNNCLKVNLIRHNPSQKRFLIGSDCFKYRFSTLYNELKEKKKELKKRRKQQEKLEQQQKRKQQKLEQQRRSVSKWIVPFGKYKGKTYNDWDEEYTCYMLSIEIFDNSRFHNNKNNNKLKDFLCNKYNLVIE